MSQTEEAERLVFFTHSLQIQQTDDRRHNMCAHDLVTNVLRSMIVVVWAQRVLSHENMNFQLQRGDKLPTFKHENW